MIDCQYEKIEIEQRKSKNTCIIRKFTNFLGCFNDTSLAHIPKQQRRFNNPFDNNKNTKNQ
ncbi:MAG: hypothetical protein EBT51_10215 [Flavobacteriaceae bacterium]|nr:hypothetical protein [Flavobacteriaceae bacterium]